MKPSSRPLAIARPLAAHGNTALPYLIPSALQAAAIGLEEADAFIHPAEDGGYVLLGLRRFAGDVAEPIFPRTNGFCST